MSGLRVLILIATAWVVLVLLFRGALLPWLQRGPRGDALSGLLWYFVRAYCRLLHRPTYRGQEQLRCRQHAGSLIIVSNHTGAIDPFLIQSACRFEIRWMMAADLMYPALNSLWQRQQFIPVARDGTDSGPAREAIRHVKAGGVLGIFPEGRIVTPSRQVWPFLPGVGLIVARTRAPVLLVWVSGTPQTNIVSRSLMTPSHARVEFVELMDLHEHRHAAEIAGLLRRRLHEVSGWPLNDHPPPVAAPAPQLELG